MAEVDRSAGSKASRSAFIEDVLRDYFREKVRQAIHARDLELINAHADYLSREAEELDAYQARSNGNRRVKSGELQRVYKSGLEDR